MDLTDYPGIDLTIEMLVGWLTAMACWFGGVAIIAIVIALVVYGIQFLTSQGNPSKVSSATQALLWGIVGGIVILGSYTIIVSIAALLGATLPDFPFNCSAYL